MFICLMANEKAVAASKKLKTEKKEKKNTQETDKFDGFINQNSQSSTMNRSQLDNVVFVRARCVCSCKASQIGRCR